MTVPRPGSLSQVYAVYGNIDGRAASLGELTASGARLRQVPVDLLVAIESPAPALRDEALAQVRQLDSESYVGVVGFDDWWLKAISIMNSPFTLDTARRDVADKALMYRMLHQHGVDVPRSLDGPASVQLLARAVRELGPRPILKPTVSAGSRGVYRYRSDLTVEENLAYYNALRLSEKVDSQIETVAVEYIDAVEVSVDVLVTGGATIHLVTHDKVTARDEPPYIDRIMASPPASPMVVREDACLRSTVDRVRAALDFREGVLHIELRLRGSTWYVLDIGVRPGMGLVGHSFHARTGVDPRLAHLRASIGLSAVVPCAATAPPRHAATCIACCYVRDADRSAVSMSRIALLADELRRLPGVFGWHLNVSEIDDAIYRPDAGLSIGIGAETTDLALRKLHKLVNASGFTTSSE